MPLIVDDLISQVRSQADEINPDNLTDVQVIEVLNRAQRRAANIVSRKFENLFLDSTIITTDGSDTYDIPNEAFGRRIEKLEVRQGTARYNIKRINIHKRDQYISSSQVTRPYYYTIQKNKIEFYPKPTGGLIIDVIYLAKPEDMVKQQGRITSVTTGSGTETILVDDIGSSLSTSATGFNAYVNIIDYVTGAVKRTLQISALDTTAEQITFKTSGLTRSTVLGKTISTTIGTDIEPDDYVCLVTGTCVSELDEAYQDYLILFGVVEVRRRFGEQVDGDVAALKDMESELEKMWVSRELQHRVKKANGAWGSSVGSSSRRLLT